MAIESSGVRVAGSEHVEMWKDGLRGSEEGRELSLAARCGRNAFQVTLSQRKHLQPSYSSAFYFTYFKSISTLRFIMFSFFFNLLLSPDFRCRLASQSALF